MHLLQPQRVCGRQPTLPFSTKRVNMTRTGDLWSHTIWMKSETVRALGPEQLRQNIHIHLIHGMYVVITGEHVSAVLTITLRSNVGRCLVVALKEEQRWDD